MFALLAFPLPAEAVTLGDFTLVKTVDSSDPVDGVDYEFVDRDFDGSPDTLIIISSTPMTVSGTTTSMRLATGNDTHAVLTIRDLSIKTPAMVMEPALDVGDSWASGSGSLSLTVLGDNLLRSEEAEGICVPFFMSLTIAETSTGRLEVVGAPGVRSGSPLPGAPAIGCTGWENGPITINGGTIVAHGGNASAGIGGGMRTSGQDITINGGDVTADSAGSGAGIGGGGIYSFAYRIAINGGTVRATGGMMGAGIGSGAIGGAEDVTISGGEVWAYGGALGGAGIGGGTHGDAERVKVTGGFVHAEGSIDSSSGPASGIGSGAIGYGGSPDNEVVPVAGFSGRLDGVLGGGSVVATAPQTYVFENTEPLAEVSFAAVPSVDAGDLPQGQVGSSYQGALAGSGGVGPYTWSVTKGALPTGLALDASTGMVTGTPDQDGEAVFTATLTDAWGVTAAREKRLFVKAAPAPVEVTPKGTVVLTGRDAKAGEFSFMVKDALGTVVAKGPSEAGSAGQPGAIRFSKMTFDAPGTYRYVVAQEKGGLENVTYDKATFEMVVTVAESGGKLVVDVTYPQGEPAFKNVYTAPGPGPTPTPTPDPTPTPTPTPSEPDPKPTPTAASDGSKTLAATGDGLLPALIAFATASAAAVAALAASRQARKR